MPFSQIFRNRQARMMLACVVLVSLTSACGGNKGIKSADLAGAQITTIGVNSYLWRASMDALSFMPMLQVDSAGGVIATDWYSNPDDPNERIKVLVSILDKDLRADALRVDVSRAVKINNEWTAAPANAATAQKLESIILTKARDLRRGSIGG